jgi:hypothetical protein
MKKLNVEESAVVQVFNNADASVKIALQVLFGKDIFKPKSVMERLNTWEDILADQGITESEFEARIANDTEDEAGFKRAKLISLAYNERPLRDDENWYMPYFNKTGFGFSSSFYDYWVTGTTVGSRLLGFKSRELSDDAGKKFAHIYKPLI